MRGVLSRGCARGPQADAKQYSGLPHAVTAGIFAPATDQSIEKGLGQYSSWCFCRTCMDNRGNSRANTCAICTLTSCAGVQKGRASSTLAAAMLCSGVLSYELLTSGCTWELHYVIL